MTIVAALGAEQCRDPAADDFPNFSPNFRSAHTRYCCCPPLQYIKYKYKYYTRVAPIFVVIGINALGARVSIETVQYYRVRYSKFRVIFLSRVQLRA